MIHVTIYHGVVHGVRHSEPVDQEIDLLYVVAEVNFWVDVCCDEVSVIRQPADYEDQDYHHHHFYHLKLQREIVFTPALIYLQQNAEQTEIIPLSHCGGILLSQLEIIFFL